MASSVPPPYLGALESEIARVTAMGFLQPDAEVDRLDATTIAWLRDRFDEHLAALVPFVRGAPLPVADVEVTRSLRDANARMRRELAPPPDDVAAQPPTAWLDALDAAARAALPEEPARPREAPSLRWADALDALHNAALDPIATGRGVLGGRGHVAARAVFWHLAWVFTFGLDGA